MNDTEMKHQLREYIRTEILNNPNLSIVDNTPLITGGIMDSFALAQIGVYIEDAFGAYVPDTELTSANMDTLSAMAACIRRHMNELT